MMSLNSLKYLLISFVLGFIFYPVIVDAESVKEVKSNSHAQQLKLSRKQEILKKDASVKVAAAVTSAVTSNSSDTAPLNIQSSTLVQVEPFIGSANLSVPIQVPPGRGGIQPHIALSYSSGNRQLGIAGVGWSLELGSIQISTKKGVPKYDGNDIVTLNQGGSQDLVYDDQAGFYRSEVEGAFARIQKFSDHWEITDKKGTKYYFGNTDDSRQDDPANTSHVFRWALSRVEDLNGNYMTISYIKDQGQLYPYTINYTGNSKQSLDPYVTITINYDSSISSSLSFIAGFKVATLKRIDRISVAVGSNVQSTYVFAYKKSADTSRDLLQSVKQIGLDGVMTLPPVAFSYSDQDAPQYQLASGANIPSDLALNYSYNGQSIDAGVRILDLNGDGYPDFTRSFFTSGSSSIVKTNTYLNTKNSGWLLKSAWNLDPNTMPFSYVVDMGQPRAYIGAMTADLNGDGVIDIIGSGQVLNSSGQVLCGGWAYFKNTLIGLVQDTSWQFPSGVAFYSQIQNGSCIYDCPQTSNGVSLADIDGDGFLDIIRSTGITTDKHNVYINQLGQGSKSFVLNNSYNLSTNTNTDLAQGAVVVDLNADGLADILYLKGGSCVVFMNTGSGWVRTGDFENNVGLGDLTDLTTQLVDINGDGLPDIIIATGNDSSSHVLINTGHGWMQDDRWVPHGANFKDYSTQFLDVNADGMQGYLVYPNNQSPQLYLNKTKSADLLVSVDNGIGVKTDIAYDSSAHYQNTYMPFNTQVVKSVTTTVANPIGSPSVYTTQYSYANGKWDVAYREFQGFGLVKMIDADGNYSTTVFLQDHWLKGRPSEQATFDKDGKLYSKTVNQWRTQDIVTRGSQVSKFVYLSRTDNYIFDGGLTAKRVAQELSYGENPQYGNPTQVINYGEVDSITGVDSGRDKTITQSEYVYNTNNWLIGLPKYVSVQDINAKMVNQAWFYYDGTEDNNGIPTQGQLTKKINWLTGDVTNSNNPKTTYTYDVYGNLLTTTDPKGNKTSITYDNKVHMFPIETVNGLNQKVKTIYYGINDEGVEAPVGPPLSSFLLSSAAGVNGTMNPVGDMTVASGAVQVFTVSPKAGYMPYLEVDGVEVSLDPNNQYRLSNITANHKLTASFAPILFNINASAGSNGTISPSGDISVAYGGGQIFTITPNSGYIILQVVVDGSIVPTPTDNSYTISDVTSAHTIAVTFRRKAIIRNY